MVASKRNADDPTESSNENKRASTVEGGTSESLISDELCWDGKGIWSELGEEAATKLSKSVVTLVVSDECKAIHVFSGVAIERRRNITRFVTSGGLFTVLQGLQGSGINAKIEVQCEGKVVIGVVEEYNKDYYIAFVKAMAFLDVYCVPLNHVLEWMPETKVVVVSRDVSAKLMVTSGKLGCSDGHDSGKAGGYLNMFPTCKLPEDWLLGGVAFDFDGNFVGLDLFYDTGRHTILPMSTIVEQWEHLRQFSQRSRLQDVRHYSCPQRFQATYSNMITPSIALLNSHHDPFGDVYPGGVWGEFDTSFSLSLSKSVVALASYFGGTKFFSCTGFFINFDDECQTILTSATLVRDPDGSNKIVEGLKIKVLLPNNQSREGKLKHCSLQYNVALISVKNCRSVCHVNLEQCSVSFSSKVVAVGRSFESRALMATRGERTCWSGPFDCEDLSYSTCKISKVGIGGPLVDIDGKFLGMNYYDKKMGTPFLYFDVLCGVLQYFKTKKTVYRSMVGEMCNILEDNGCNQNQWILPDPSSMNKREREEERKVLASLRKTRSRRIQYAYTDGYVTVLK